MEKIKLILTTIILVFGSAAHAQMVLEYDIATANTEITLPLYGTVNVNVDWGDGSTIEAVTIEGLLPHTFTTTGTKTVTITGTLTQFRNDNISQLIKNERLTKVLSWDGLGIISFKYAFRSAFLLTEVPTTLPSTATNLSGMFAGAIVFNQNIGNWNTAAVTDMSEMFLDAEAFNQPIGTWNTAAVTNMHNMFEFAFAFNQPIGTWNTSAVTNMFFMFADADAFNQPIGAWNIEAVTNMDNMFYGTGLCTDNYDATLIGWSTQNVKSGVNFVGGYSNYSSAASNARATLINKGWTIVDAGLGTTNDNKCTQTATKKAFASDALKIYPNPTAENLQISFMTPLNEALNYSIYSTTGVLMLESTTEMNDSELEIVLGNLPQGLYVLNISTADKSISKTFVKK